MFYSLFVSFFCNIIHTYSISKLIHEDIHKLCTRTLLEPIFHLNDSTVTSSKIYLFFYDGCSNCLDGLEFHRYSGIYHSYRTTLITVNQFTTHKALWDHLKLIISVDLLSSLTLLRSASCRARCLMTRQGQICVI